MGDPVIELAARQHGLVAVRQAAQVGLTTAAFRRRLDHGGWEPVTDRVARRTGAPQTRAARAMAAVLHTGPRTFLSHTSAGNWWGLRGVALEPFHVVTTRHTRRAPGPTVVHTVRDLPPEWTFTLDGVPVVRPELLAVHLFAIHRYERAERLVEQLWARRLLHVAALRALLADLGRSGRNGIAGLRRYLDERGPRYVPPASGLEARVLQIFREAGIPMERQVDTGDPSTWLGRVDFRHRRLPVVLEVQSELHHTALVDRRADAVRLAALRRAGYEVVEVMEREVWQAPGEVVRRVASAIHAAAGRP